MSALAVAHRLQIRRIRTVTLESADFPLNASVTDCRTGAAVYSFSVPNPGGVPATTPTPQPISCGNGESA